MTVLLVHGLPETVAVWEPLQALLGVPSTAVAVPGFGVPALAAGGGKDDLAAWLAAEVRAAEPPVDLVAHDLGALLALRVVSADLAPVRSWAVDVADLLHPGARWPDRVRVLQTPGTGERLLEEERPDAAARFEASGVPPALAARMAAFRDAGMEAAVLAFYRSAVPDLATDWWADAGSATGAGLVLLLPDPPEVERRTAEVAARLGAATASLGGLGYCWTAQDPERVAGVLHRFWAGLG